MKFYRVWFEGSGPVPRIFCEHHKAHVIRYSQILSKMEESTLEEYEAMAIMVE